MPPRQPEGFSFRARKSGDVEVWHAGTLASVLRGADAAGFRSAWTSLRGST